MRLWRNSVCRRLYSVRGRLCRDRIFSSSVMVLKSSPCHLGKMRSVGSGVRHSSPRTSELSDTWLGARTPSTRPGRTQRRFVLRSRLVTTDAANRRITASGKNPKVRFVWILDRGATRGALAGRLVHNAFDADESFVQHRNRIGAVHVRHDDDVSVASLIFQG
jgi:hypothetical protein